MGLLPLPTPLTPPAAVHPEAEEVAKEPLKCAGPLPAEKAPDPLFNAPDPLFGCTHAVVLAKVLADATDPLWGPALLGMAICAVVLVEAPECGCGL